MLILNRPALNILYNITNGKNNLPDKIVIISALGKFNIKLFKRLFKKSLRDKPLSDC